MSPRPRCVAVSCGPGARAPGPARRPARGPWRTVRSGTATAELAPAEQVRVARLALERARRRAEAGADVVLIVDSLSRLAVAAGEAAEVKRLFGSGRDLAEEGAGSL